jgi:hypothetical protein
MSEAIKFIFNQIYNIGNNNNGLIDKFFNIILTVLLLNKIAFKYCFKGL